MSEVERASLRPLAMADLDALMAIEVRCYAWPWSRGNFIDSLAAGHWAQGCWVPVEDGSETLAAYVWAMEGVDELHLLNLTVAPEWQRRGLALRLLEALMKEARRLRCERVFLEVRASNAGALRLYERAGFEAVGIRRGYYPDRPGRREDAIVMRRELLPTLPVSEPDSAAALPLSTVASAETDHAGS